MFSQAFPMGLWYAKPIKEVGENSATIFTHTRVLFYLCLLRHWLFSKECSHV